MQMPAAATPETATDTISEGVPATLPPSVKLCMQGLVRLPKRSGMQPRASGSGLHMNAVYEFQGLRTFTCSKQTVAAAQGQSMHCLSYIKAPKPAVLLHARCNLSFAHAGAKEIARVTANAGFQPQAAGFTSMLSMKRVRHCTRHSSCPTLDLCMQGLMRLPGGLQTQPFSLRRQPSHQCCPCAPKIGNGRRLWRSSRLCGTSTQRSAPTLCTTHRSSQPAPLWGAARKLCRSVLVCLKALSRIEPPMLDAST